MRSFKMRLAALIIVAGIFTGFSVQAKTVFFGIGRAKLTWRGINRSGKPDEQDVVRDAGGRIDAAATFNRVDPDGVPTASGSSATGGTYGEHILSRPFENLGGFIQARVNDNPTGSKRIERFRLPRADSQPRIRFRFTLVGTGSWFWGIDDFGLFGTISPIEAPLITRVAAASGTLELEWTGPQGPFQVQARPRLGDGYWENLGDLLAADQRSARLPITRSASFYRLRIVR